MVSMLLFRGVFPIFWGEMWELALLRWSEFLFTLLSLHQTLHCAVQLSASFLHLELQTNRVWGGFCPPLLFMGSTQKIKLQRQISWKQSLILLTSLYLHRKQDWLGLLFGNKRIHSMSVHWRDLLNNLRMFTEPLGGQEFLNSGTMLLLPLLWEQI